MNIEQTKRMNHMIKQLTAKGIVSQFDEAVQVASNLYDNAMPDSKESEATVPRQEQQPQQQGLEPNFAMVDRKIKFAIQHNNELINAQFQKMWDEVQKIRDDYQRRLSELKAPRREAPPAPKESVQKIVQTPSSAQEASSPRSGDFTPENIVLESYFYCGR